MTSRSIRKPQGPAGIAARIITAIAAGYAIVYFAADALGLGLVAVGWASRADAVLISTNLAFLLAPAVVIWVFSPVPLWKAVTLPFASAAMLALLVLVL